MAASRRRKGDPYATETERTEDDVAALSDRIDDQGEQPWDRLKGETARQFATFETYRQLPPHERYILRMHKARRAAGRGSSLNTLHQWAICNHWRARALAWDEHKAKVQQAEARIAIRDMSQAHVASLSYVHAIANMHLERVARKIKVDLAGDPDKVPDYLGPKELIAWLRHGQELEADARGRIADPAELLEFALRGGGQPTDVEEWRARYLEPERTFIPHPKQRALVLDDARFPVAVAGVQSGKLLRKHELVRTPTGWTRIGELEVGDLVIGGTGMPCKVLGVYPSNGKLPFHRLTFDDGANVEACEEHLWRVLTPEARRPRKHWRKWSVLSTKEILGRWGAEPESRNRVAIPVCVPYGEETQVPIPPYLLGALIADGSLSTRTVGYSKTSKMTVGRVASEVGEVGSELVPCAGSEKDWRVKGTAVRDAVESLGLGGKRSWEKHAPRCYLDNSIAVRRDLMAGLMDGDGTCTKPTTTSIGGTTTYTTTSPQLRDDVLELARSLGWKASSQERQTYFTYKGERKQGRLSYRIRIRATENPFWTEAKASRWFRADGSSGETGRRGTPDHRLLYRIEPTGEHEGVCIEVADPTHTYVTKDYIVTHNTAGCALAFWRRIIEGREAVHARGELGFYWMVAPNAIVGEVMCEAFETYAPAGEIIESKGRHSGRTWKLRDGSRVQFRSGERSGELVARKVHGAWLDEFTILKKDVWTTSIRQRLATTGGWCIFSGTPRGKNWAFDEVWRRALENDDKHDPDYSGHTWPSEENPAISAAEVAAARRQLPEVYFLREWRASWQTFRGQIYAEWREATMLVVGLAGRLVPEETVYHMGVDWGMAKPGAAVVMRKLPSQVWHVVEEVHAADKLPDWWHEIIAELWAKWRVVRIWCDPEDPGRIGTLQADGLPALKADNAVHEGIRSVAKCLKQARFFVDSTCKVTAAQIESYHWKEDNRGNRQEQPTKENDHLADSARYVIHSEGRDVGGLEVGGYGSRPRKRRDRK